VVVTCCHPDFSGDDRAAEKGILQEVDEVWQARQSSGEEEVKDISHVELPTIVYRNGGNWPGPLHPDGSHTTFSILGCDTHEQVAEALKSGWCLTPEEACWGWSVHEAVSTEQPTRDEMLAMAERLGLRVDKRWSDETLLGKIDAAIADSSPDCVE